MKLDRLILKGFLTYEYLDYYFQDVPLLVQGLNLTDEKQKSNGAGKSGIQTGIEFCITASNSRDVRDVELVTYGLDAANTQLFASCDIRKESIHIDWKIKAKGSNKLVLKKKSYTSEEWVDVKFSNVNDGKKVILDWFAISKEDLFNYYLINSSRFKSFFKSSNTDKVNLINRFSDASIVDGVDKIDNTELNSEYEGIKSEIGKLDGKIELKETELETENARDLKAEVSEEVSDIEEEIESVKSKIEELKKKNEGEVSLKGRIVERNKAIVLERNGYVDKKAPILLEYKPEQEALEIAESDLLKAEKLVNDFVATDWNSKREVFNVKKGTEETKIDKENKKVETQNEQESKLLAFLKGIDTKLAGSITCPSCSHEFTLDGDINTLKSQKGQGNTLLKQVQTLQATSTNTINSIKGIITDIELSISGINGEEQKENDSKNALSISVNTITKTVEAVNKRIKAIDTRIEDIDLEISDCDSETADLVKKDADADTNIKNNNKSIENFNKEIENYETEIKNISPDDNAGKIKDLIKEISTYKSEKSSRELELGVVGDKIYERNQWIANFKQFRMYLANQSLDAIEFHCNRYLAGMGSDLKVKLEGYKILADGTIKDEITAKIIRNVERTFSSFSGGEKGRLLFASILANRHMINSTHPYGGLDFLSVDEVFEGVDGIGLKYLVESAKQLQIAVMIITHVTDEEANEDVLTIVKENAVSRILEKE